MILLFLFCLSISYCYGGLEYADSISRGAEIRLTSNGMRYAASIGVQKLEKDITMKKVGDFSGQDNSVTWNAENVMINYITVNSYKVQPIAGVGLSVSLGGISVAAKGRVSFKYKKGWARFSDSTEVKIKGKDISFTLRIKFDADKGKPVLSTLGCSASVGSLDLDFSGGLGWIYNLFSSYLERKLKGPIQNVLCKEGQNVINREANTFLSTFPVTKKIDHWAVIDYSFERPLITNSYIDLLLRGEFLSAQNPKRSSIEPSDFNTADSADKMLYFWLSDYTVNSAGRIYHQSGRLRQTVTSKDPFIPDLVKPFLSTKVFKDIIPEAYNKFPDRPIQLKVETFQAPTVSFAPGNVQLNIYARIAIDVEETSGSLTQLFFVNLSIKAKGVVKIATENSENKVGGNIDSFSFSAEVGGSIIGNVVFPVDNKSIKEMVQGLVIDKANPILNNGFALPQIKHLKLISPSITIVQNAVRIDTDAGYQ